MQSSNFYNPLQNTVSSNGTLDWFRDKYNALEKEISDFNCEMNSLQYSIQKNNALAEVAQHLLLLKGPQSPKDSGLYTYLKGTNEHLKSLGERRICLIEKYNQEREFWDKNKNNFPHIRNVVDKCIEELGAQYNLMPPFFTSLISNNKRKFEETSPEAVEPKSARFEEQVISLSEDILLPASLQEKPFIERHERIKFNENLMKKKIENSLETFEFLPLNQDADKVVPLKKTKFSNDRFGRERLELYKLVDKYIQDKGLKKSSSTAIGLMSKLNIQEEVISQELLVEMLVDARIILSGTNLLPSEILSLWKKFGGPNYPSYFSSAAQGMDLRIEGSTFILSYPKIPAKTLAIYCVMRTLDDNRFLGDVNKMEGILVEKVSSFAIVRNFQDGEEELPYTLFVHSGDNIVFAYDLEIIENGRIRVTLDGDMIGTFDILDLMMKKLGARFIRFN